MYSREFNKHFSTGYHDVDDDDGDFMFMSNFISILKTERRQQNRTRIFAVRPTDSLIYVACFVGFVFMCNPLLTILLRFPVDVLLIYIRIQSNWS